MTHINNFSYGALNPVLAYLISCVGCFLGLRCTTRARAHRGVARARWLTLAALAIGTTGIWVMHFVAMLGFTIPGQTIRYNVPVTILSMVIAVIVVGIGTFIVGFSRPGSWPPLLLGGLIIGLGVASMHYIGMMAIRVQDSLSYNPFLFAASVIIAVIAGTAALWATLRLDALWATFVASLIMGVAVNGMHYTGMAALRVYPAPEVVVNMSGTAGAAAFLLPLILGLGGAGFIFSAIVALSPTATEILEEDALMRRLGQAAPYQRYEQYAPPGPRPTAPPSPEPGEEPGSLFRPHHPR